MLVWPRTRAKLQTLVDDIRAVYGEGAISHRELADIIYVCPEDYPSINTVKTKASTLIAPNQYLVRMPKEKHEFVTTGSVKKDAEKLLGELFD